MQTKRMWRNYCPTCKQRRRVKQGACTRCGHDFKNTTKEKVAQRCLNTYQP